MKTDPIDTSSSLERCAAELDRVNRHAAERMRFYAVCARLGLNPSIDRLDPLDFALDVIERDVDPATPA